MFSDTVRETLTFGWACFHQCLLLYLHPHNRLGLTEKGEIAFMETMPYAFPKHFIDVKLGSKLHIYCVSAQGAQIKYWVKPA